MKSIAVLFLFIVSLSAGGNRTAPSESLENARVVAKQGWDAAEEPLKDFIEKDGRQYINAFLKKAVKPYETAFQKDLSTPIDNVPKMYLTKADNTYALAYAKYLESRNKTDEALELYRAILKGLKEANSGGAHMIGVIYRIVIERLTTESIRESLARNLYTAQQKRRLHDFLINHLLLNTELLYLALEDDRHYLKKFCRRNLVIDNEAAFLHHPGAKELIEDADLNQKVFQEICKRLDQKREALNRKMYHVSNEKESESLEKTLMSEQAKLYQWLAALQEKPEADLEKLRSDPNNFINVISDILFYISTPRLGPTKLEMLQSIESNKKLIEKLQPEQTPGKAAESVKKPETVL